MPTRCAPRSIHCSRRAPVEFAITFLEGIITFISPCLLPMLPIYVAYFAGDAAAAGAADRTKRTLLHALGFVLGFTLLFTAMGVLTGTAGSMFREQQAVLDLVCGLFVVAMGLNYLGILRIPLFQRTFHVHTNIVPRSFAGSVGFGIVFALGWTPCVGAFLGSALSLAASTGQTVMGMGLLFVYSLGLGIPFIIAALLIDQLEGAFAWVKSHYDIIDKVCGSLLVLVGVLMATGMLGTWLRLLAL